MINNPAMMDPGTMSNLRDDLSETMRSIKDTLAMSFQQLNLTLSTMNMTLRNMAPNPGAFSGGFTNMMPSSPMAAPLGSMSMPMANYMANAGMMDLAGFTPKPFNVSSMEFYRNREEEMRYRAAPFAMGMGAEALGAGGMYAGYKIGNRLGASSLLKRHTNFVGGGIIRSMAVPMVASLGISAGIGLITGAAEQEAQNYMTDQAMFARAGGQFSGGSLGRDGSARMASWLNTAGNREMYNTRWDGARLGTEGYRDLASSGLSAGLFKGASTEQLKKQIENAAQTVRFLAGVMGSSDVKEAINAIVQLKQLGFNPLSSSSATASIGRSAFGLGAISGISGQQMMGLGMGIGQNLQSQMGLTGILGMRYGMHGYANAQSLERIGALSAADMGMLGGAQGAAHAYARGMGTATMDPRFGGMLMGAMMGPNGKLSGLNASGGYFGVMGEAMNNTMTPGRFAMMHANRPEMMESLSRLRSDRDPVLGMMNSAFSPIIEASGAKGRNEKTAMMAMMMSQTMGIDMSTAKMMANMAMYPELTRRREGSARAEVLAGDAAEARSRHSMGGRFGNAWDIAKRPFSDRYADFTSGIHGITNWIEEATGAADVTRRNEYDRMASKPFDPEVLRKSSSAVFGSRSAGFSDKVLDSYYGAFRGSHAAYADQLDADKRRTQYGDYYSNYVKNAGSENVYKLAKEAGVALTGAAEESYLKSGQMGKIGGGIEWAVEQKGRTKLIQDWTAKNRGSATVTLSNALGGIDVSGFEKGTIENKLIKAGKLNSTTIAALAALGNSGTISASTLAYGNEALLKLGAEVESQYTDAAKLKRMLEMGPANFSAEEITHSERSLGMSSAAMGKYLGMSDDFYSAVGKVAKGGSRDALSGLSAQEQRLADQLIKGIDKGAFKNLDDAGSEIKRRLGIGSMSLANSQFDFTAKNVWQLNDEDAKILRAGMSAGGNLGEALSKINTGNSPGLEDLKGIVSNVDKYSQYGHKRFADLSPELQRQMQQEMQFDVNDGNRNKTVAEIGRFAIDKGTALAMASGDEKFAASNKTLESTLVSVNGKTAMAVVIFEDPKNMVVDLNDKARGGYVMIDNTGAVRNPENKGGTTVEPKKTPKGEIKSDGGTD